MRKFALTLIVLISIGGTLLAQSLLPPSYTFSHKKTSYITMKDGKTVEGTIKDLDRKKGNLEEVKITDGDGKKVKLKPEDISHMYLPSSGWDKMSNAMDFLTDANRWDNDELDQDMIAQGYVYFETTNVMIKKKRMSLLMQLLNPHFSGKIKVYHDPWAKETMGAGIGGVTLIGGLDKSYYVQKKGAKAAVRLKKKDYDEEFQGFYGSCKKVASMKPKWEDFVNHVHMYATECD